MASFTKEQLIAHITAKAARIKPDSQVNDALRNEALMNKRVLEIALAALTAPDIVPRPVYNVIYEQCGGFVECEADAQVIWTACRSAILEENNG